MNNIYCCEWNSQSINEYISNNHLVKSRMPLVNNNTITPPPKTFYNKSIEKGNEESSTYKQEQ